MPLSTHVAGITSERVLEWGDGTGWLAFCAGMRESR